jgi:dinuclear metal center YbgI/SA1388 family protein
MPLFVDEITAFLDELTASPTLPDFPNAYNGLQITTEKPIQGIAAAVDASFESIQKAIALNANYLVVHHGLFWNKPYPLTGAIFKKYQLLIENGCAIYSSHLPLDAHIEFGNNAAIAQQLKAPIIGRFGQYEGLDIGVQMTWQTSRESLKDALIVLFPKMTAIEFGPKSPKVIAIASGSGTSLIPELIHKKIDTLITGELKQHDFVIAQEHNLNLYCCGHYATEVFAVQKVAEKAATKFNLPYHFIPSSCPL